MDLRGMKAFGPWPHEGLSLPLSLICSCPSWSMAAADGSSEMACHSAWTGGR